jgi:predicted nucleic acid-binding protein
VTVVDTSAVVDFLLGVGVAAQVEHLMGDLPLELFPSLVLRDRAWELRRNLTVADALFVALAERLGEPLATKDRALVNATARHSSATALTLA